MPSTFALFNVLPFFSSGGRKRQLDSPQRPSNKKPAKTALPKRLFGTPISPSRVSAPKVRNERECTTGSEWFECDDDYVSVLSQEEMDKVLSPTGSTPYLLFYKQCDAGTM